MKILASELNNRDKIKINSRWMAIRDVWVIPDLIFVFHSKGRNEYRPDDEVEVKRNA